MAPPLPPELPREVRPDSVQRNSSDVSRIAVFVAVGCVLALIIYMFMRFDRTPEATEGGAGDELSQTSAAAERTEAEDQKEPSEVDSTSTANGEAKSGNSNDGPDPESAASHDNEDTKRTPANPRSSQNQPAEAGSSKPPRDTAGAAAKTDSGEQTATALKHAHLQNSLNEKPNAETTARRFSERETPGNWSADIPKTASARDLRGNSNGNWSDWAIFPIARSERRHPVSR